MSKKQLKSDVKIAFGRKVRRYRRDAGITQAVAAERCGIHRTYLSRIEAGVANSSITVASALANTLSFEIRDLFL